MTEPQILGVLALAIAAAAVPLFGLDKAKRREDFSRHFDAKHEEPKPVTDRSLRDVISAEARAVELAALRKFVAKVAAIRMHPDQSRLLATLIDEARALAP